MPHLPPLSIDQRRAYLSNAVGWEVAQRAGRVESATDVQAVIVYGRHANHVLHLALTVLTLGLWAPVWLIVGVASRETRAVVYIDEWGNVIRR